MLGFTQCSNFVGFFFCLFSTFYICNVVEKPTFFNAYIYTAGHLLYFLSYFIRIKILVLAFSIKLSIGLGIAKHLRQYKRRTFKLKRENASAELCCMEHCHLCKRETTKLEPKIGQLESSICHCR